MKATITFTDKPDGNVNVTMDFDPPVTDDSDSRAQMMAIRALDSLKNKFDHEE